MPRLSRECIITEKIDGTNAQISIVPRSEIGLDGPVPEATAINDTFAMFVGSRTRWIRPKQPGEKGDPDNYGFAHWCKENAAELFKLGPGRHFGEWFGRGINRAYGMEDRKFALFNVSRWAIRHDHAFELGVNELIYSKEPGKTHVLLGSKPGPLCCTTVPLLYRGLFDHFAVKGCMELLRDAGSSAAPGFRKPEGIVIYHIAAGQCFKKTIEGDESPKGFKQLLDSARATEAYAEA